MAARPSPFAIAIGTLILLHSDPSSPYYDLIDRNDGEDERLNSFLNSVTISTTTIRIDNGSSHVDLLHAERLASFSQRLEAATSPQTRNCCFYYVSLASKSLDGLHSLVDSFQLAIGDAVVLDPDSARGIYLRQVCLGFDLLSFETTTVLFQCLRDELEEMVIGMKTPATISTTPRKTQATTAWPRSVVQMDSVLRQTCHLSSSSRNASSSSLSFEQTELQIQKVLAQDAELPSAYFWRFLNCMRHGEKNGALEALHQYFDYAMIKGESFTIRHDILQYAAILLAAVYSYFGDDDLSLAATDEAVRVAQQSRDGPCVAFALGWLFHNHRFQQQQQQSRKDGAAANITGAGNSSGSINVVDLLQRCSHRAADGHLRSLVAGANSSLAQYLAQSNNSYRHHTHHHSFPQAAWLPLMEASTDHAASTSSTGLLSSFDRATHITDLRQSTDALHILVRQWSLSAGVWDSFGHTALSGLYSFLPLHCQPSILSDEDVIHTIQNVARAVLYGSTSVVTCANPNDPHTRLFEHRVVENLESNMSSTSGGSATSIYGRALTKLLQLWKTYHLPMEQLPQHGAAMILHEWAVRRGDLLDAEALMVTLQGYLHPRLHNYHDAVIDTLAQKSLLLSRRGNWDEAKRLLRHLCSVSETQGLRSQHARLLVQLAWMQFESSRHHTFVSALPPLLDCLSLCERFNMDGIHATALSILAKLHLRMFQPKRAVALLHAALPLLLQNEHIWYQAEAYLTLAKCYLQRANQVAQKQQQSEQQQKKRGSTSHVQRRDQVRQQLLPLVRDHLETSANLFEQCQDLVRLREIFYLHARVCHALLQRDIDNKSVLTIQREAAAQRFVKVSQYLLQSEALREDGGSATATTGVSLDPQDCGGCILHALHQPAELHRLAMRTIPITE